MKIENTLIDGCVILTPDVFKDERGYFFESYNYEKVKDVIPDNFIQDNQSVSTPYVLRGLHMQKTPFTQSKLVRCIEGSILDVCVDVRPGSKTFGKYVAVELTADNFNQLYIPAGCLHGFNVLRGKAVVAYKCDNVYNKESEVCVRYDDPDLNIDWKFNDRIIPGESLFNLQFYIDHNPYYEIVSEKDLQGISFKELCSQLNCDLKGNTIV